MDRAYVEALMREALTEAGAAGEAGEYRIGAVVAVDGAATSRGRSRQRELRDESRALFERYEPRLLDWLDDKVTRHSETRAPD